MPMKNEYRHGDWNLIDDRTGFKIKRSDAMREWTGHYVHRDEYEARHPQDFVKGIKDTQGVPDARPDIVGAFTQASTTLDADELPGQTVLSVTSTANMTNGDRIGIELDNSEYHYATISSFSAGDTVTISTAIPEKASSGNTVVLYSNLVTGADL